MRTRMKNYIKHSRTAYLVYYYVGSLLLKLFGLFIRTDPDLVLFISYGGQKYDDSPRVVYEYLLQHKPRPQHRYVWAFIAPEEFPQVKDKVRVDTPQYFLMALRAGCWITNSSASRGLNFKKKGTKNYFFTHGMTGIKKIGADIQSADKIFKIGFKEDFDRIFIEGKQEAEILTKAWQVPLSTFALTGLPRNDDLATVTDEEIAATKEKIGLPLNRKVILYAPTFREFSRAEGGQNALGLPFHFDKWEEALGDEYVLLITAHYEVAKLLDDLPDNGFVFNAFQYPELNDLIKVSDVLISDYSSIVFDYAIMERPIFCYGYDYDAYKEERGVYTDLDQLFSHGAIRNEEDLLTAIKNMDYEAECEYTKKQLKDKYMASYGDAAAKAVAVIFGEANV